MMCARPTPGGLAPWPTLFWIDCSVGLCLVESIYLCHLLADFVVSGRDVEWVGVNDYFCFLGDT